MNNKAIAKQLVALASKLASPSFSEDSKFELNPDSKHEIHEMQVVLQDLARQVKNSQQELTEFAKGEGQADDYEGLKSWVDRMGEALKSIEEGW